MNDKVRLRVMSHISERADVWTDIMESIYVLTLKDWIGSTGVDKRKGIPGIWGHSYIRTFNNWIEKPPAEPLEMEGGIATTFFVLRELRGFLTRLGSALCTPMLNELTTFLVARTNPEGTGVQTTGPRGNSRIDTNIRHTCLAYLIAGEIANERPLGAELQGKRDLTASIILEPISQSELLLRFLNDSWPVGAIAAYILASDLISSAGFGRARENEWKTRWSSVRRQLIEAIAALTSRRIDNLSDALELASDRSFAEHQPFWHPINDLKILQLHSTLGCLSLMGRDLAQTFAGRSRISNIVNVLRERILSSSDKAPRFEENSRPSIAAAAAILKILLGSWYEPTERDFDVIFSILVFIENNWANPEVYEDYWSEFTAPVLDLEEMHAAIGGRIAERFMDRGLTSPVLDRDEDTSAFASRIMQSSSIRETLLQITPTALGVTT